MQTCRDWRLLFVDGPSSSEHKSWLHNCVRSDSRIFCVDQDVSQQGIFGAMNQGFSFASPTDFILFWGSDDWAAAPTVLTQLALEIKKFENKSSVPDLFVSTGRYVDSSTGVLGRSSFFRSFSLLTTHGFKRALFLGSTPPHQGTLFSPRICRQLDRYSLTLALSADLDYFLRSCALPGLSVQCLGLELVHMSSGGVSARQTRQRLFEVFSCYYRAFGWLWWIPYGLRYFRRFVSIFTSH